MIDLMPNQTFFYQLGIFLLAFVCLNYLVFQPVLRIIARRQSLTEGARAQALKFDEEAEVLLQEYQTKIQWARSQAIQIKEKLKKEGEAQARELTNQTRQNLEASLEKARHTMTQESLAAQKTLQDSAQKLSREIVEKLLGRKVEV